MVKENRSRFQIRLASAKRLLMWHYLSKRLGCVLMSEFPKSGGTWLSNLLSEATGLPFPENRMPKFEACILHGHHLNHDNFERPIHLIRDGRDVIVSAYYHFLSKIDVNATFMIQQHRSKVPFDDYDNIEKNLPAFIEYMFTNFTMRGKVTSWKAYLDSYLDDPDVLIVKYEDLLLDAKGEIKRCLIHLDFPQKTDKELDAIVEKFSFKNLTKRKPGQEAKSFLRKGISGDWKNKFSPEACKVFDHYAGDVLIKAGYEENRKWVNDSIQYESN